MDNKIFLSVFNNVVLFRYIFEKVRYIHSKKQITTKQWKSVSKSPKFLLSYGYLEDLKRLLDSEDHFCSFSTIEYHLGYAAGHLQTIQYLHLKFAKNKWPKQFIIKAATVGCFEVVKFVVENRKEQEHDIAGALVAACINNSLEIAEYLYPMITIIDHMELERSVITVAERGHLNIIKYLYQLGHVKQLAKTVEVASVKNHFDIVRYIDSMETDSKRFKFTPKTLNMFARYGEFELLKKIPQHNCLDQSVDYAAGSNRLEMVQWLTENKRGGCTNRAIDLAAERGYFKVIRYLHENRSEGCSPMAMDEAAKGNHMEIVKFLHENRSEGCTVNAISNAAKYGHFEMIRFLVENRTERFSSKAVNRAASKGHFEIVKYLYNLQPEKCNSLAVLVAAAKGGHTEIVKYFFGKISQFNRSIKEVLSCDNKEINQFLFRENQVNFVISPNDIDTLIIHNCLDGIKLIHERKPLAFDGNSIIIAISHKRLAILQFLYENCPQIKYYRSTLRIALLTNDLDIVRFVLSMNVNVIQNVNTVDRIKELHDIFNTQLHGPNFASGAMELVVKKYYEQMKTINYNGSTNPRFVVWFHQMGINHLLKSNTLYNAVVLGELDIVKYIYENRSEYTKFDHIENHEVLAAATVHFPVFQYLYPKCNSNYDFYHVLKVAATKGALKVIKFFHTQHPVNIFSSTIMDLAANRGHADIVKFLHYNRTEGCSHHAMDGASFFGSLELVRFLHENRSEGCSTLALDYAIQYNRVELIEYLKANRTEGFTSKKIVRFSVHC
ncbi:hypothetical protein PPL_09868 [Heterostelium album PN500]|uniref:Ankyrin repeat protein n=1 Tax=Heterostelium pallidum (strain ATCC 26659 / Pp 5 / PN500) TaxID=670386 RepID=D3BPA5_HETP5|nr:hypothetical protein PPL_09868 [Heterostelium album PN500]EFA77115.1 hypothetical protein PPL_09868 [Heterostelium album PN500]|eukprot:XP_020429244.1 hypothetical protein PPL_09868 [Heterostelium album PN500]